MELRKRETAYPDRRRQPESSHHIASRTLFAPGPIGAN